MSSARAEHDSSSFEMVLISPEQLSADIPNELQCLPTESLEQMDVIPLDGQVMGLPCPDCEAPMAVRLWLGVADCRACNCSIELSEEEERRLLEELRAQQRAAAPSSGEGRTRSQGGHPRPATGTCPPTGTRPPTGT